jgi:hypothetical protein
MLGDLDLVAGDAVIASGDHVVASDDTAIKSARAAHVFPGGVKHNVGLKRTFTLDVWYDFKYSSL